MRGQRCEFERDRQQLYRTAPAIAEKGHTLRQSSRIRQRVTLSSEGTASLLKEGNILFKVPPELCDTIYALLVPTGDL